MSETKPDREPNPRAARSGISFEEALTIILESAKPCSPVCVPIHDALGRGLSDPLFARFDSPRFDNSAVDGYGMRLGDASKPLRLVGISEAGSPPTAICGEGQCVRILTGAAIPEGVEMVAMQEDCEVRTGVVTVPPTSGSKRNIRRRGEEYQAGDLLLPEGTAVTPSVIGLLATHGIREIRVPNKPRVSLVGTGNELMPPGFPLEPGQIYESNRPALAATLASLGIPVTRSLWTSDDEEETMKTLASSLDDTDILIVAGGMSVGDRDIVRESLESLGVEEKFWRIRMKPGGPVYFGQRGRTLVIGLPGNPVATLVAFTMLARPMFAQLLGIREARARTLSAILTHPVESRRGRTEFLVADLQVVDGICAVTPHRCQESHRSAGIAAANALIHLPEEAESLDCGAAVRMVPLGWGAI